MLCPHVRTSTLMFVVQGLVTVDLGCYADNKRSRVFEQGLMDQTDLTPDVSAYADRVPRAIGPLAEDCRFSCQTKHPPFTQ